MLHSLLGENRLDTKLFRGELVNGIMKMLHDPIVRVRPSNVFPEGGIDRVEGEDDMQVEIPNAVNELRRTSYSIGDEDCTYRCVGNSFQQVENSIFVNEWLASNNAKFLCFFQVVNCVDDCDQGHLKTMISKCPMRAF